MRWRWLVVACGITGFVGCGGRSPQLLPEGFEGARIETTPTALARSQKAEDKPAIPGSGSGVRTTSPFTGREVAASISATVNGQPIFREEVEAAAFQFFILLREVPEPERTRKRQEIEKQVLDQLIERELVLQDAYARLAKAPQVMKRLEESANKEFEKRWLEVNKKGNGFRSDDEFKEFLRRQGLSLDTVRRQWVRNFMSMEYLRGRVFPSMEKIGHEQLVEYYESHPEEFTVQDSVQWQDLLISTRKYSPEVAKQRAEEVLSRLKGGEEFSKLSPQYDDGDSVLRNGEGIGHKRGEIKPEEAEPVLFRLRDGESGPLLETPAGYHVIRLVKREYAGKKPFDAEVQKQIRLTLRNEVATRETKKYVAELRRKAVIDSAEGRK